MSTQADDWRPKLASGIRLQFEPAQDGWVLLYPEGMVQLNQSATEILRKCDGNVTIAEIVALLEAQFNIQSIAAEVEQLINEGQRRGWLV